MTKRLKRPRDPVQLGKLIGDILTGQVEDRAKPLPKALATFGRGLASTLKASLRCHGMLADAIATRR